MKGFATLCKTLDQNISFTSKAAVIKNYFLELAPDHRLWGMALLSGWAPKRSATLAELREWAEDITAIPSWLFDECYAVVGDISETIALCLTEQPDTQDDSLSIWINKLEGLPNLEYEAKKTVVEDAWKRLNTYERFIFNKLVTGGFKPGVDQKTLVHALSLTTGKPESELTHRLNTNWYPGATTWYDLMEAEDHAADLSHPYPFCHPHELADGPAPLGDLQGWHAEWKLDGVRAQLILRGGQHFVWSAEGELLTDRLPEMAPTIDCFPPGTVLDGELLVWPKNEDIPANLHILQTRLRRKSQTKKLQAGSPVILQVFDLLEWQGKDIRTQPQSQRRAFLETACAELPDVSAVKLAPRLNVDKWEVLAALRGKARARNAQGLLIKRASAPYPAGQETQDWWIWKQDPLTINAILIYAHSVSNRSAKHLVDFTFAVWNGNNLVPFTKTDIGINDGDRQEISDWVGTNTQERFGPVRQVTPFHVFEIAFDGIQHSKRHKSGVTLRDPVIKRWHKDKPLQEAATLEDLNELLRLYG